MLIPSLSFKGTTQAYLKTHNKNLIPLLYLLNNCISAKSAPQVFIFKCCVYLSFIKFSNNGFMKFFS